MEIERKYLVKQLPENLGKYPHFVIEQGYLCTEPTIRIRRKNNDYILPGFISQNVVVIFSAEPNGWVRT